MPKQWVHLGCTDWHSFKSVFEVATGPVAQGHQVSWQVYIFDDFLALWASKIT